MLHDRYDVEIEQAVRLLPFDGRDNDEKGAGMFCDLANQVVSDFETFTNEERWEALYNAFHKIREATLEEVNRSK